MNVLFLELCMNSLIVCLCIVFFLLNGGIVLYECDYRTDIFLNIFVIWPKNFPKAGDLYGRMFSICWAIGGLSHLFYFVFLLSFFIFFLISLSITPPVLEVCQLLTNHPFVQWQQWHLEHVSISSCYREWIQISGKVCLMSADMNEDI